MKELLPDDTQVPPNTHGFDAQALIIVQFCPKSFYVSEAEREREVIAIQYLYSLVDKYMYKYC